MEHIVKNKLAVANVISALMKNPQLVLDDRYPLSPDDFPERFHKIIFAAIDHIAHSGAKVLDEIVVDDYLAQYPQQHKVFEDNGGMEYLQRAMEVSESANYEYYHTALKKCSLLNQLADQGYDIKKFYDPDAMTLEALQSSQSNLDQYSLSDIIDYYDMQISALKGKFCSDSEVVECHISKGMRELKEELSESPAWGLPMNSSIMTTICHGRRLKKFYLKSLSSGLGKALVNSTLIPTYDRGMQRVDAIRPGDRLIGRNGQPTTVLAVHPQPEKKQVYRVHFEDGRTVDCCKDHLWSVRTRKDPELRTVSTEELLSYPIDYGKHRPLIPLCSPMAVNAQGGLLQAFWDYILLKHSRIKGGWECEGTPQQIASLRHTAYSLGLKASLSCDNCRLIINDPQLDPMPGWLAITNIEPLDIYEDMTCFTVDAPDALFLCNDYIVTHNTRLSIADACRLAISQYYDPDTKKWIQTTCESPVLFITTELELSEIQTMLWAYVACVPEDHILDNKYVDDEEERVEKAIKIVEDSEFFAVYIANFDMEDIENIIKRHKIQYGIEYVFHDYIFTSAKIFTEMSTKARGFTLREDQSLMVFSDKLKSLCNKYNIHIDSSTQTNDEWKTAKNPDQSVIRGARAIADKVDIGYIGLEPNEKDKEAIGQIMPQVGMAFNKQPNLVYHVYKVRRGKYNHVKVFIHFDYGTLRTTDMFVTDRDYHLLDIKRTNIEVVLEQTDMTEEAKKLPPVPRKPSISPPASAPTPSLPAFFESEPPPLPQSDKASTRKLQASSFTW